MSALGPYHELLRERYFLRCTVEYATDCNNILIIDIDNIDNLLGDALSMLASAGSQILGSAIIISIILPWFLIVVFAALSVYCYIAMFYRANARELRVCQFVRLSPNLDDVVLFIATWCD